MRGQKGKETQRLKIWKAGGPAQREKSQKPDALVVNDHEKPEDAEYTARDTWVKELKWEWRDTRDKLNQVLVFPSQS